MERVLPGWSEVTLTTADGLDLEAWYASPEPGFDTPVVVLPWAGTRADRVPLGFRLAENGLGVVMVDDRGYAGSPSESGLALDARAAARFVARAASGHPVVFLGESLGAAVAIELAAQPPAALILRSPFTSLADVAQVHYPLGPARIPLWDEDVSHRRIGSVAAPVR